VRCFEDIEIGKALQAGPYQVREVVATGLFMKRPQ
jgi:hypothetical protein